MTLVLDGDNGIVGVLTTNNDGDVIFDTDTFFVDAITNQVGVGTITPNRPLHVNAGGSSGTQLHIQTNNSGSAGLKITPGSNSDVWEVQAQNNGNFIVYNRTDESYRLVINGAGDVGIGTETPVSGKTHIHGGNLRITNNTAVGLKLRHTTATYDYNILQEEDGSLKLLYGPDEHVRFESSGNVGIGTNDPAAKLDVQNSGTRHEVARFKQNNSSYNTDVQLTHTSRPSDNTLITKRSNGDLWLYQNNETSIKMYTQGLERAVFHHNGNTGIRSQDPRATLEVYGYIRAGKNSSQLNASIHSYSSSHNSVRIPENLYSGLINYEQANGGLGSDWLTATGQRDDAYVIFDLGATKSINRMVVYNQNEYEDSRREVKGFMLQGTNDVSNANSWVTVLTDDLGKSGAHEPNPGWSFRLPAGNQTSVKNDPVDDDEAIGYRYWKFVMKDFWGSDSYGGIMEVELYEYSVGADARQDEISSNSMVATDVYAQTLSATGDINLIGKAQVNYNYHPVPSTMAPHSIPGLSSYLDMQHSYRYPRSGSVVDRYTLADLGNEPMSWTLRNENAAALSNSHMVDNIPGVVDGRYSMKTGSNAAGGGTASTNQDRYHMMTYDGPVTFVWIAMRGSGGGFNSNESLLTQNTNASSYGYQIIRHYPSYANIYNTAGTNQNIAYPTGYTTAASSTKWFLVAHSYWDTDQQTVTFFNNSYPNGNQQTSTANYDWRWKADSNSRKMVLGGSEWGSYGEAWGQGSSSSATYGAIGAFMYYKNSLSIYDLKTIFDYYKYHYDMG